MIPDMSGMFTAATILRTSDQYVLLIILLLQDSPTELRHRFIGYELATPYSYQCHVTYRQYITYDDILVIILTRPRH